MREIVIHDQITIHEQIEIHGASIMPDEHGGYRPELIYTPTRSHSQDLTGYLLAGGSREEWEHLCLPMNYQPSDVPPMPVDPTKPNLTCPPRMVCESNPNPMPVKPPIQILRQDHEPTPENLARDYNAGCPVQGIEYRYIDGLTYLINVPAFTFEEAIARMEAAIRNGKHVGELKGNIPASIPGAGLLTRLICWFQNLMRDPN